MSGQLGQLVVSLAADIARFREDMGRAQRLSNETSQQMSRHFKDMADNIEKSTTLAARSLIGLVVGGGIVEFSRQIINAGLAAEKMGKLFAAASGNVAQGARELEYIRGVANKMGLDFQSTAESYGKFNAALRSTSMEGDKGRQIFESVSKASTALGLSVDETKGIFNALQQMISKGKVQAEELRGQLGERLPGAFKMAADAMGVTTSELDKMLKDGKVLADDLLPKLAAQLDKVYGKAAADGAKGAQAEINRMNNAWLETKTIIGEGILPAVAALSEGIAAASRNTSAFMKGMKEDLAKQDYMNAFVRPGHAMNPFGSSSPNDIRDRVRRERYGVLGASGNVETGKYQTLASRTAQIAAEEEKAHTKVKEAAEAAAKARKEAADSAAKLNEQYQKSVIGIKNELALANPALDDHSKQLLKVDQHYEMLFKQFEKVPGAVANLKKLRDEIKKGIDDEYNRSETLKQNERLGAETDAAMASGDFNSMKYKGSLQYKNKGFSKGNFSLLNGETGGYKDRLGGQFSDEQSDELKAQADFDKRRLALQEQFNSQKLSMELDLAEQTANIAKNLFEDNKTMAIAFLAIEKGIAIARVMINTSAAEAQIAASAAAAEMATIAAYAGIPGGLAIGSAQAMQIQAMATAQMAAVGAMGNASIGLIVASGLVEAGQIAGQRAMGGPVGAGKSYLVGERGPEIVTMGSSGYVTPSNALGGSVVVNQSFSVTGVAADITQNMKLVAKQAGEQTKAEILNSMNRGGSFAMASGRR